MSALKRIWKRVAAFFAVLATGAVAVWFLWREIRQLWLAQDAAWEAKEQEAKGAIEEANKARERAHTAVHKASKAKARAQGRIERIEQEAEHGGKELGEIWDDWRNSSSDGVRDNT